MQGRFCHICGQENIEIKESFWHLVSHFMYDITHFDGKFFSTLKYLLFRPGFLSHEYLRGRRADYLHPIRMYVFTSAFFFLVFFSLQKDTDVVKVNETPSTAASQLKKLEKARVRQTRLLAKDSSMPAIVRIPIDSALTMIDSDIALLKRDTTAKDRLRYLNDNISFNNINMGNSSKGFKTIGAYDSAQERLPADKKDGFIERRFERQSLHLKEKYHGNNTEIWTAIIDRFRHLFPQMLFVSLPLFALALQLLYISRKRFFYVNHVVYTIHLYCGTFIIILASLSVEGLFSLFHGQEPGWIKGIFILLTFFYWYKSQRNFYEQGRAKTILKYVIILFVALMIMTLLFTLFFIFSAMAI